MAKVQFNFSYTIQLLAPPLVWLVVFACDARLYDHVSQPASQHGNKSASKAGGREWAIFMAIYCCTCSGPPHPLDFHTRSLPTFWLECRLVCLFIFYFIFTVVVGRFQAIFQHVSSPPPLYFSNLLSTPVVFCMKM